MPDNEPVVGRRLVKQCCPKRDRSRTEESRRESNQAGIEGDLPDDPVAHQVPCASTTPLQSVFLQSSGDICDVVLIQDCRDNLEAADNLI